MNSTKRRVLFLCTGNYYRSRFAEVLFNQLAMELGLAWEADSCGLRVQPDGVVNHGPMSVFALAGLRQRGLHLAEPCRFPRQVTAAELATADVVVAVKEVEHRPLMERLHPGHVGKVEFWGVHDLDMAMPAEALAELEALVRGLVDRLVANVSGLP